MKIAVGLLVLAFAAPVFGQVAVDNTASSADTTGTSITISSFVLGTHSNRMLLVGIPNNNGSVDPVSGVTWNTSENFTNAIFAFSGNADAEIWYLVAPTQTTANIVASFSTSITGSMGALSAYNADTTFRDTDSNTGTTETSNTLTLTTVSGDLVMSCIDVRDEAANVGTLTADGTEIYQTTNSFNAKRSCQYKIAAGSSTSIQYTWGEATEWAHVAVVVKAIAAGGPGTGSLTSLGAGK